MIVARSKRMYCIARLVPIEYLAKNCTDWTQDYKAIKWYAYRSYAENRLSVLLYHDRAESVELVIHNAFWPFLRTEACSKDMRAIGIDTI